MISLESRRYIGSKAKLTDWIMETISNYANDAHSFCDIFAGTAIVAKQTVNIYERVIINDFLLSNNIIYKAFFGLGDWDFAKLQNMGLPIFGVIDLELSAKHYLSDKSCEMIFRSLGAGA